MQSSSADIFDGNWLYALKASEFIQLAIKDSTVLAETIAKIYQSTFNKEPSKGEKRSWQNSLPALASVMHAAHLQDQLIVLEYCPPSRDRNPSRVDAIICGADTNGKVNAVMIELKQWSNGFSQANGNFILVPTKNKLEAKIHPRKQIEEYRTHMKKILEICDVDADFISFTAYAYLHNASHLKSSEVKALFGKENFDEDSRLYTKDFAGALVKRLREHVGGGKGEIAFQKFKDLQTLALQNLKKLPKRPNYRWLKIKKNFLLKIKHFSWILLQVAIFIFVAIIIASLPLFILFLVF